MPDNWLEKQFENERKIRKELPDHLIESVGGVAGRELLRSVDALSSSPTTISEAEPGR